MTRKKNNKRKLNVYRTLILIVLTIAFIVGGAGIGFFAGALKNIPNVDNTSLGEVAITSYIFDKNGDLAEQLHGVENRTPVSLENISPYMKDALLAIEDQRFYKHRGVDPYRIAGAFVANLRSGRIVQGGSTLTQQLVGLAMLDRDEKSYTRKIQEALIALKVENDYTKDELLEFYLNRVYFGHGAYGVEAASKLFFGKSASDLTIEEAALLAGVIQSPGRHSPITNPDNALTRRAIVLNSMVSFGKLTQDEANELKKIPITLTEDRPKRNEYKYQSFVDHVIAEAIEILDLRDRDSSRLFTDGFRIYTTLDTTIQSKMDEVYADPKNFPQGKGDQIVQSAMVVINPKTGEIPGLIGGRNQEGRRQFNRATQALRQPGSALKPVAVYAPALEKGYSPATVLDDYPKTWQTPAGPWTPKNYDNRYRGLVSMRTALQYSINVPTVKMMEQIGISEGYRFAESLGISTLVPSGSRNDMGLSLSLGGLTRGVSPLELTAAYAAFANQGIYIEPYAITKIEDRFGNILWEHKIQKRVVMSPESAFLMNSMLQTAVDDGTAARAKMPNRAVAGKTGTTSNNVDAWFVGYTADYVGSVWLGFDQVETMNRVFGGTHGAPIWRQVMDVAHKNVQGKQFARPEGITQIAIDSKSGLLPSEITPADMIRNEIFNQNFVPGETSNVWVRAAVCPITGEYITENCPDQPITGVFLRRPQPWNPELLPDDFKHVVPEDAHLEGPNRPCTLHGSGSTSPVRLNGEAVMNNESNVIRAARLTWSWPQANENTIYHIYRSNDRSFIPNANNRLAVVQEANASSYLDESVRSGQNYYYRVVAVDRLSNIQTPASNVLEISGTNQSGDRALMPPRLQAQAKSDNGRLAIELTWSKPHNSGDFTYYVFRSEQDGFEPGANNQIAQYEILKNNTYIDTDVQPGKTYYYKVIGMDTQLNRQSPVSNQATVNIRANQ